MPDHVTSSEMHMEEHAGNISVYLLSLGCVKNLVDSECMCKIMTDAGYKMVKDPNHADVLVINTCGFIESAKREAIDAVLALSDYKKPRGKAAFLIVSGCLPQRYAKEINQDLPEVDAVLGTADYAKIADTIEILTTNGAGGMYSMPGRPGSLEHLAVDRIPTNFGRYAYVKIAEGCDNHCSYCAIPGIRGAYRSRAMDDIVEEARRLSLMGYDEIIPIAQDTTRYGKDLYNRPMLRVLLRSICRIPSVRQVRLMYTYSDDIDDPLIEVMAEEPKIAHYLDMPIQHAADRVLSRMNRRDTQEGLRTVIGKLRAAMPDMILRTTVLVGFPGETDDDFSQLKSFIQEIRFDRLGCFTYSREEGTPAYQMCPRISSSAAQNRRQAIMKLQKDISKSLNRARIGNIYPVTLESIDDSGIFFIGRSYGEAPDVDPVIYVAASTEDVRIGQTCPVRLVEAGDYDMTGVTVQ